MKIYIERMNNPKYINWLKCQQFLLILTGFLKPLILKALNDFVENIRQDKKYNKISRCNSESCARGEVTKKKNQKSNGKVPLSNKTKKLSADCTELVVPCCENKNCVSVFIACCENQNCALFIHAVQSAHEYPANASFKNCNISRWSEDNWEVAKVFLRIYPENDKKGETERNEPNIDDHKTGGSDTLDIAGCLTILINCREFKWITDPIDVKEQRNFRNFIFHTPNFEVSDDDLNCDALRLTKFLNQILNNLMMHSKYDTDFESFASKVFDVINDISEVQNGLITVDESQEQKLLNQHVISVANYVSLLDSPEEAKEMKIKMDCLFTFFEQCEVLMTSTQDSVSQLKLEFEQRCLVLDGRVNVLGQILDIHDKRLNATEQGNVVRDQRLDELQGKVNGGGSFDLREEDEPQEVKTDNVEQLHILPNLIQNLEKDWKKVLEFISNIDMTLKKRQEFKAIQFDFESSLTMIKEKNENNSREIKCLYSKIAGLLDELINLQNGQTSLRDEMKELRVEMKMREKVNDERNKVNDERNSKLEGDVEQIKAILRYIPPQKENVIAEYKLTASVRKHGAKKFDELNRDDRARIARLLRANWQQLCSQLNVSEDILTSLVEDHPNLEKEGLARMFIDGYIADHPCGTMNDIYDALVALNISDTALDIDKGFPAVIEASQPSGDNEKELGAEAAAKIKTDSGLTDEQETVIVERGSDPGIFGITNAGSTVEQPTGGVEEKSGPATLVVVQSRTSLLAAHDLSLDSPFKSLANP